MVSTCAATKSAGLCGTGAGVGAAIAEADVDGGGGVVDVAGLAGSFLGAGSALAEADAAGGFSSAAVDPEGAADADGAVEAEGAALGADAAWALVEAIIDPNLSRGRLESAGESLEGFGSSSQPTTETSGTTNRKNTAASSEVLLVRRLRNRSSMGDQRVGSQKVTGNSSTKSCPASGDCLVSSFGDASPTRSFRQVTGFISCPRPPRSFRIRAMSRTDTSFCRVSDEVADGGS